MESLGIIGIGRFGQMLGKIFADDFIVKGYDANPVSKDIGIKMTDLESVLKERTIILAVPIRDFKDLVMKISPQLKKPCTVIDVCSVKVFPVNVMKDNLPKSIDIIGTHPLFGPDSYHRSDHLKIMMCDVQEKEDSFLFWSSYFVSKGFQVIEMSPEEHDKLAARTQGITHFIGRSLMNAGVNPTSIDTLGFSELYKVIEQTCNDSWELFKDLQNYNPYTQTMIDDLENSIAEISKQITGR